MSVLQIFFQDLANLPPTTLAAATALAGAAGAVVVAIITGVIAKFFVTPFLGARDRQDKEAEWRKHAIELTKLDLERNLKTRQATDTRPLRPSILDFLANYRDLQDLDKSSPRELYSDQGYADKKTRAGSVKSRCRAAEDTFGQLRVRRLKVGSAHRNLGRGRA